MRQEVTGQGYKVRGTHFPVSMFFIILSVLLLMSGVHVGLIIGVNTLKLSNVAQTMAIIFYWIVIAVFVTLWISLQMRKIYEVPMRQMAEATDKVANGDFSVYIPPLHTPEKLDYLDVMIMDFNKMVEELGSIETLKTDFFSNVSHEIKTPIAVVQNSAEMLKNTNLSLEEQQMYVDTIIQSSKKLSSLITNILKLNKLEKQNIQPVMEEYNLCEQLCQCSLQFENIWEEKEITFDAELEDKVMIHADESLLELVWTNLLSNAMKFTENGGMVRLTQTSTEKEVVVSVSDTGCGMSQETMKHIFDKFYQGD
ncbi:MAG: HAMP domain-containing histidine kinase, partial [Eubacterium sp.]|nr:HAMP domain-containing histidine kinase [Eubacterium sp.]